MRLLVGLGCLVAACATVPDEYDTFMSFESPSRVSQEMAWRAACGTAAWEGIRVDAMRVTVWPTPTDGTVVHVSADCGVCRRPGVEPKVGEDQSTDLMFRFVRRFPQALAIVLSGKPLPPEPPPLPSQG